jgi:glycerophosphoryl diester phosphodiesterase
MKINFGYLNTLFLSLISIACLSQSHEIRLSTTDDLHAFFRYQKNQPVLIAGHRGGMVPGFPENSIATFENTLKHTPAFFEIDPRLTKDSVIVLMHDATLDRTTTSKGKLSDYTYKELENVLLKDAEGNITPYGIPTLAEVIEWARGRTILNLDHKEVPLRMTSELISKHQAEAFVMLTVHSAQEAKYYLNQNKNSMFSAFIKNEKDFDAYRNEDIPFTQMIAYIGPTVKPENKKLYDLLNAKGTMCMISAASSYDKLKDPNERRKAYQSIAADGAGILESDYPIEAAQALGDAAKHYGKKSKFFGKR